MGKVIDYGMDILFLTFFVTMAYTIFYYHKNIKPVADRRLKRESFLARYITWSGQDITDYWEVEKEINQSHNPVLIERLRKFRFSLFVLIGLFLSLFVFAFLSFLVVVFTK